MKLTPQRSYVLCFGTALLLDQLKVFSEDHFYEAMRQPFQFTPYAPEFTENIPFVLLGFVLIPVMFYWRKLIRYIGRLFLYRIYDITEGTYKVRVCRSCGVQIGLTFLACLFLL